MGWSIGWDNEHQRDIGYGVPAICDYPSCKKKIDRGLGYVCGSDPYGGEYGCGLFFCDEHLEYVHTKKMERMVQLCERCAYNVTHKDWHKHKPSFEPKPDIKRWLRWKLKHSSWALWRKENPGKVEKMEAILQETKQ